MGEPASWGKAFFQDEVAVRALMEADEVVLKASKHVDSGILYVVNPEMEFSPTRIAYIICHPDDEMFGRAMLEEIQASRRLRALVGQYEAVFQACAGSDE